MVYPLRTQHNSLPVSVQTLATYMLALLNPLGLWFTRIVVDQVSSSPEPV
jgi:hypothetical protein